MAVLFVCYFSTLNPPGESRTGCVSFDVFTIVSPSVTHQSEWTTAVLRDQVRDHDVATPALLCLAGLAGAYNM